MLISYSHEFMFVHTAKTAGTSIRQQLEPYAHEPAPWFGSSFVARCAPRLSRFLPYRHRLFSKHASASTAQAWLPEDVYRRLFKFAFVRNPWERTVSYYHYVMREPRHHLHRRVRAQGGFAAFLNLDRTLARLRQKRKVIDHGGQLIVDFVGRYETLQEDFASICRRLRVPCRLAHLNRSRHGDFRSYYEPHTRQRVAEIFAEDIAYFGYKFEADCTHITAPVTAARVLADSR